MLERQMSGPGTRLSTYAGLLICAVLLLLAAGLSLPGVDDASRGGAVVLAAVCLLLPVTGLLAVRRDRPLGIVAAFFGTGAGAAAWLGSGWSAADAVLVVVAVISGIGFVTWTIIRATRPTAPVRRL